MNLPNDLLYAKTHEWVKIDGTKATIGISDYAQDELGDVTFVELPDDGTELNKGDFLGSIESVKAASDIFAVMSGTVTRINRKLEDTPGLVNQSPYEDAWIAELKITDESEKEELLDTEAYRAYLEELSD